MNAVYWIDKKLYEYVTIMLALLLWFCKISISRSRQLSDLDMLIDLLAQHPICEFVILKLKRLMKSAQHWLLILFSQLMQSIRLIKFYQLVSKFVTSNIFSYCGLFFSIIFEICRNIVLFSFIVCTYATVVTYSNLL